MNLIWFIVSFDFNSLDFNSHFLGLTMKQREQLLLELHANNPDAELWIVLDKKVYDISKLVNEVS